MTNSLTGKYKVIPSLNFIPVDSEYILQVKKDTLVKVNQTAKDYIELIAGGKTPEIIIKDWYKRYSISESAVKSDILSLNAYLLDAGVIKIENNC